MTHTVLDVNVVIAEKPLTIIASGFSVSGNCNAIIRVKFVLLRYTFWMRLANTFITLVAMILTPGITPKEYILAK